MEYEIAQVILYLLVTLAMVKPLGWYMAQVYEGRACGLEKVMGPVERLIYRVCAVKSMQKNGLESLFDFNVAIKFL